jgi:hypothetical protein
MYDYFLGFAAKRKGGSIALFLPQFIYVIITHLLFWMNWGLDALCNIQLSTSEWNEPEHVFLLPETLKKLSTTAEIAKIHEKVLSGNMGDIYDELDLVKLFDSLPAADTAECCVARAFHGRILVIYEINMTIYLLFIFRERIRVF